MKEQKQILHDLMHQYIQLRANNNLVFSVTHTDKENTHVHLVISANKVKENKRMRLPKKVFNNIKKQIEAYKNQHYPQLKKTLFYDKAKTFTKPSRVEQEMQHKRNKQSKKEFVKEKLREFFKTAQNEKVLKSALNEFGFELYRRGKNTGVKYKNQSFRFSTLGFDKTYSKFLKDKSAEKSKKKEKENNHMKDEEKQEATDCTAAKSNNGAHKTKESTNKSSTPESSEDFEFQR